MKKFFFLLSALAILTLYADKNISAQSWKKVVPLVSTCEQLKEFLPITDCNASYSKINVPEYEGTVFYSQKTCQEGGQWNIVKGTVIEFIFTLKPFVKLTDYGSLEGYVMKPEDDLPDYKDYTNRKLGIGLSVLLDDNYGELIQSISLLPSEENKNKFKCDQKIIEKKPQPGKKIINQKPLSKRIAKSRRNFARHLL